MCSIRKPNSEGSLLMTISSFVAPKSSAATALNVPDPDSAKRRVVVGIDATPASTRALAWVRDNLLTPSDELCVVTAYQTPHYVAEVPVSAFDPRDAEFCARRGAQRSIDAVFGSNQPAGGLVHIVELSTIDDMIDRHGSDAAFVVLGSRSRRRISERLRPSATNRITGRTTCPVISVPELDLTSTVQGTVKNEP
jgi:nucleotide-binding universal stress UspA family protein